MESLLTTISLPWPLVCTPAHAPHINSHFNLSRTTPLGLPNGQNTSRQWLINEQKPHFLFVKFATLDPYQAPLVSAAAHVPNKKKQQVSYYYLPILSTSLQWPHCICPQGGGCGEERVYWLKNSLRYVVLKEYATYRNQ